MRKATLAASCAALLATLIMGPAARAEKPPYPKRVWTNDDFASAPVAARAGDPAPAAKAEPKPSPRPPAHSDPEVEAARNEVLGEVLAMARIRQKAYEDSAAVVNAKLEKETNPFRIDVLQKILKDTLELSAANQRLLEQLGGKAGAVQKDDGTEKR